MIQKANQLNSINVCNENKKARKDFVNILSMYKVLTGFLSMSNNKHIYDAITDT